MKIEKVLNNSTVIASDNTTEMILLGRGIGFNKKAGDKVDETRVEKKYVVDSALNVNKAIYELDDCYFRLSKDIIDIAESELKTELNKTSYILLADHINFSISRCKEGKITPNIFMNEIQLLYPKQYKIGQESLAYIFKETGIELPIDEAGYIALHIVNSSIDNNDEFIEKLPKNIDEIVNIIENHYRMTFKKDIIEYSRFVTHLKYLLLRLQRKEWKRVDSDDSKAVKPVIKQYAVVGEISTYIYKAYHKKIGKDEEYYLNLHLGRLINS
ncbi:PRD domain-containing protein [Vagococcus elongatus]|uniref:PRD domain-containing protein n=1 Tax=Vagococcus elongatus TaxID=180344 RepID=A0A430ART8_9ENTE|nr:PRD domain-containing protein [Vagococcus elongatus]RSU10773.1 hypothetical protein CBF29_09325 [Vagococcus elongatus]